MGKNNKNKRNTNRKGATTASLLPQNIRMVGAKNNEGNNLYVHQKTYRKIIRFVQNKKVHESGGLLLGHVSEEAGKMNVSIDGFIEAKYTEATTTTLTFTHETWEYFHAEIDKRYKGMKIVGWIHTHPDFGIFLSEYDRFVHENFFKEPYQVAYVIDTIQKVEGFYGWDKNELVKCNSFFLYDDVGKQIADPIQPNGMNHLLDSNKSKSSLGQILLYSALALVMVIMLATLYNQHKQIVSLQSQLDQRNFQLTMLYDENETLKQQLLDINSTKKQD